MDSLKSENMDRFVSLRALNLFFPRQKWFRFKQCAVKYRFGTGSGIPVPVPTQRLKLQGTVSFAFRRVVGRGLRRSKALSLLFRMAQTLLMVFSSYAIFKILRRKTLKTTFSNDRSTTISTRIVKL